ncbi:hypothetical protein QZH41_009288, partial [Actinostola sp. cb2023]
MCEKVLALKMENDVSKSILADGIDNIALLGHVGAELSCFRREQMKPGLKHEFRPLCSKELDEPSPLLFGGDDLPKRIRDAKETTRIGVTVARDRGQKDRQSRGHRRPYDNNHYQRTNGYSNGGKRQNFFGKGPKPGVIPNVLKKIQEDGAKGILVVPDWATQAWYPKAMKLLTQPPMANNRLACLMAASRMGLTLLEDPNGVRNRCFYQCVGKFIGIPTDNVVDMVQQFMISNQMVESVNE